MSEKIHREYFSTLFCESNLLYHLINSELIHSHTTLCLQNVQNAARKFGLFMQVLYYFNTFAVSTTDFLSSVLTEIETDEKKTCCVLWLRWLMGLQRSGNWTNCQTLLFVYNFQINKLKYPISMICAFFFVVLDNEIKELECSKLFTQQSETQKHLRMKQDERESRIVFVSQFIFLPNVCQYFLSGVFVCFSKTFEPTSFSISKQVNEFQPQKNFFNSFLAS